MQTLCDREDNFSKKSFISARFTQKNTKNCRTNHNTSSVQQKTVLKVDLTDLSSKNLSYTNKRSSVSCNRDKRSKSKRNQKAKSTQDSSSRFAQKISRSIVKEKDT